MKMKMKCLFLFLLLMLGLAGCQPEVRLESPIPTQYIRTPKA